MTDPSIPYTAQLDSIEGWFYAVDVDFFSNLLAYQRADGIKGDMLEIGTYQGKSAILMGYGLRDDEELVVCDLFGAVMDHADIPLSRRQEYSGLQEEEFLANWDRFHARRPTLEVCESSELDLGDRVFRFIHVDGCHSYQCVVKDIRLAAAHTAERGVIALDDYRAARSSRRARSRLAGCRQGLVVSLRGDVDEDVRLHFGRRPEVLVRAGTESW